MNNDTGKTCGTLIGAMPASFDFGRYLSEVLSANSTDWHLRWPGVEDIVICRVQN